MDIIKKIKGVGLMVAGVVILCIEYFILKKIDSIASQVVEMNMPVAIGMGVIMILTLPFLCWFGVVAYVGICVFLRGVCACD